MSWFRNAQRGFAEKAAALVLTNPFDPAWMERQRDLLGPGAADTNEVYAWAPGWGLWGPRTLYPDVVRLGGQIIALADEVRGRIRAGVTPARGEQELYETLAMYALYRTYGERLDLVVDAAVKGRAVAAAVRAAWDQFREDHKSWLLLPGVDFAWGRRPEHAFACFFALRRAFYHILFNLVGRSQAVIRLRTAVWQSIITHDLRGWGRALHARMGDFPTLITGPSGTGKELVAQAVGRSRYIEFDPARKQFRADFLAAFQPVNLAALPPLLIESELFGHAKGSFATAIRDRVGRLEECPASGAVFLDEVGELTGELQVKLLRVLQARRFQRVGENADRQFVGKILAATNRDLGAEVEAGRFREDIYYRLCADRVQTPTLREQLADRPEDLGVMVEFISRRVVGEEEAPRLSAEVVRWVEQHLGLGYGWPGNFRELEQCVRSYTIRKGYIPLTRPHADALGRACASLADAVASGQLDFAAIRRGVFAAVRARSGSHQEAARRLGVDWRTLKAGLGDV